MSLPLFYIEEFIPGKSPLILNEETSRHIVQILRMKEGERLRLTDGKGRILTAEVMLESKKATEVNVLSTSDIKHKVANITIAISLIKNSSRFEWFLEKATEIGISAIVPLICERTEKQHFRLDRMESIVISAMLQSQQAWLPVLNEPVKFANFIRQSSNQQKYIAHCIDDDKKNLIDYTFAKNKDSVILIGPEGDFTIQEITAARQNNFLPVSLGENRLRTETAGVVAAVVLKNSY